MTTADMSGWRKKGNLICKWGRGMVRETGPLHHFLVNYSSGLLQIITGASPKPLPSL